MYPSLYCGYFYIFFIFTSLLNLDWFSFLSKCNCLSELYPTKCPATVFYQFVLTQRNLCNPCMASLWPLGFSCNTRQTFLGGLHGQHLILGDFAAWLKGSFQFIKLIIIVWIADFRNYLRWLVTTFALGGNAIGMVQHGTSKGINDSLVETSFILSAFKSSDYKQVVFLIRPTAHFKLFSAYSQLICKSQVGKRHFVFSISPYEEGPLYPNCLT